jgi:hypothetical protein
MGTATGANIVRDGLVFAIDSYSPIRGKGSFANSGDRKIIDLVHSNEYDIGTMATTTGGNPFTMIGITYPESSYSPASRQGITSGYNNTTSGKLYSMSRDMGYFVYLEDSETWLASSYFNGERTSGHCYDTYDGQPDQHLKFQQDFNKINSEFPDALHVIIGSHAAENNDNDSTTLAILQSIGLPSSHIGVTRPEYVLLGKIGKPHTHHYIRENISTAYAKMNIHLPIEGKSGAFIYDGTDDYFTIAGSSNTAFGQNGSIEMVLKPTNSTGNNRLWCVNNNTTSIDAYLNGSTYNVYMHGGGVGTTTPLISNQYNHIVATYTNGTLQIYINGEPGTMTGTTTGYSITNSGTLYIGSYNNGGYNLYGNISLFKIYNRGITSAEVKRNYNAYKNRT